MDTERYIVAVEIGSSKITGAIGTRSLKGVVTVLGVDTEPLTGSVTVSYTHLTLPTILLV